MSCPVKITLTYEIQNVNLEYFSIIIYLLLCFFTNLFRKFVLSLT